MGNLLEEGVKTKNAPTKRGIAGRKACATKQKARPDGRGRAYDFTVARDVKRFGAGKVEVVEGKGEYNFQFREMKKLTGQKSWGRYFIFS